MQFFYWNKNFEIGIAEVDRQHRQLIDMINDLAAAIIEVGGLPEVRELFSRLMEYAATHFHDEEKLLAAVDLPKAEKARHLAAHRGFVAKAQEIGRRTDLLQAEVAEQVLEFLTTWLITHIFGSDQKIAQAMAPEPALPVKANPLFDTSPVERMLLEALTETERRFRMISDQTPSLIWVSDALGARGYTNHAWYEFVGVKEETGAYDWSAFVHPEDLAAYASLLGQMQSERRSADTEYRIRRADGEYRWLFEKILPRIDAGNVFMGLIGSATDITAIKQAELLLMQANRELEEEVSRRTAQLERLTLTDPLTGVGNRRLLQRRLQEEVTRAGRYGRPLTVAFIDIDHFKLVNDTYGHDIGDEVLVSVAESLRYSSRDCDIVGRFGGEEFVVLLPETGVSMALSVVERMRAGISAITLPNMPRKLTASAGVAEWRSGESGEDVLKRSDKAVYSAKGAGRNCYRIAE